MPSFLSKKQFALGIPLDAIAKFGQVVAPPVTRSPSTSYRPLTAAQVWKSGQMTV